MTKCSHRIFREAHADLFEPLPHEAEKFRSWIPNLHKLGLLDQAGIHTVDGRILFVSAFYEIAPGVAEGLIFPSVLIHKHKKDFLREAKWFCSHVKSQYRRFQCYGDDTEVSRRWLKALGFKLEGELKSYTMDGSSILIWGMVE